MANRNENEHANPFLKPAQELAAATIEGAKGLPGALFVSLFDCVLLACTKYLLFYRSLRLDSMRRTRCTLRVPALAFRSRRTGETSTRLDFGLSDEIFLYCPIRCEMNYCTG